MYIGGHGTFYSFDEAHYNEDILKVARDERVSLILWNLNTEQLDEVVIELDDRRKVGSKYLDITGYIADSVKCFRIKIEFFIPNPLESRIKVFASARPDYDFYCRKAPRN